MSAPLAVAAASARDTYVGLRAFIDELARCGLRHACTSPGSRSTPLLLTFAWEPRIRSSSHIDERGAGFFALGCAKATGVPAALICTSGTAAANYAPAVCEAHEARVPLLVLTADRPPELRDIGAGQTIDQVKLYGTAVKWYLEVDDHPGTQERLRWLRQLACRVFWTAVDGRPGPVHLNFSLREPLVLDEPLDEIDDGRPRRRPWVERMPVCAEPAARDMDRLCDDLRGHPQAVIVAGATRLDQTLGPQLASFADRLSIPLLADPLSGARRGRAAIAHYDALLRDGGWASEHAPDLVLRVGDLPTSKPLRQWLESLGDVLQVAFDPENALHDPAAVVAKIVRADPCRTLELLAVRSGGARDRGWLEAWRRADTAAGLAIDEVLLTERLSEPLVAAELGRALPPEATCVVASSMPVRDVETFFPARAAPCRVLANRGANGIDGTVSTAFGVASVGHGPTVLLIGDVALLHDLGGLLAASRLGVTLTIVLLHNDGGGIFEFLPVSRSGSAYVEHVATPHGLDLSRAAALYGCGWEAPHDLESFRQALARALAAERTTIIAVRSQRSENVALHARLWECVAARVASSAAIS